MKNKRKLNRVKLLALLLFYLAVFFLSFPIIKQLAYITTISTMKYQEISSLNKLKEIPFEAVQPLSVQEVLALDNPESPAIGLLIDGVGGFGGSDFPGISDINMGYGAAAAYPERDPEKQNIALLGHHIAYDKLLFGKIVDAKVGDSIEMVYLGKAYSYRVTKVKSVSETAVEYMEDKPAHTITLITCDHSTSQTDRRVVVVGELQKTTTKQATIKSIKAKQQTLVKQNRKLYWTRLILLVSILLLVLIGGTVLICKLRL